MLEWDRALLTMISPVDTHETSPAGTAQSWLLRWLLSCWSECRYTSQSDWSCHCEWSWRCRRLNSFISCTVRWWGKAGSQKRENAWWFTVTDTPEQQNLTGFFQICISIWDHILYKNTAAVWPSRMGVASRTCCSIQECWPLMAARNCRISFVLSVFPAPDSPLQHTHDC